MSSHTEPERPRPDQERTPDSGQPAAPAESEDKPEGNDFAPEPAPRRSDQMPEDAPAPVSSDG
jgi:hypothetical protein